MGFCNMKIQSISSNYFINNRKVQNSFVQKQSQQGDVFVSFKSYKKFGEEPLVNKSKFQISDYKKLSEIDKEEINQKYDIEPYKRVAQDNINYAIYLKKKWDLQYGEGNYVFECVGTSPAPLARVCEFMGVETHYYPFSEVRLKDKEDLKNEINSNKSKFEPYKKFLAFQGLKGDDEKYHLFIDFTCSRTTLDTFKNLLQDGLSVPKTDKIKFLSINKELRGIFDKELNLFEDNHERIELLDSLNHYEFVYFVTSNASTYANIPHLPFSSIAEINNIKAGVNLNSQLYNFCVMDKLNEMGLLKENPLNKVSL